MSGGLQGFGFLHELTRHFGLNAGSPSSIEGHGRQAVALSVGQSIFKVFSSSASHCGLTAHNREVAALNVLGGYEGHAIRTARLGSHALLESPFEVMGNKFVGFIEQSRVPGTKPNPVTPFQYADIGNALGEFHSLLDSRASQLSSNNDIIAHRIGLLKDKKSGGHSILPGMRKKVLTEASKIAQDPSLYQHVHGDFHLGNILFDGEKYGIIDLATIGKSVPEQDMTAFVAASPENLKDLFKGYAHAQKRKPSQSRTIALAGLDLAIAADLAGRNHDYDRAKKYADKLQSFMS